MVLSYLSSGKKASCICPPDVSQIFPNLRTPTCSRILHTLCASRTDSHRYASYIPCSGSCPTEVHVRLLQTPKHIAHFCPSRCMVCNLIFHTDDLLPTAHPQFLFQEEFTVHRRLTDISVQKNLIYRNCFILFFHKLQFSAEY